MAWAYRDIASFPARHAEAMREAVASLNTPIVFNAYSSRSAADAVAESFRHFRWCLRKSEGANTVLCSFEDMFDFRTNISYDLGVYTLYLLAQPTKLSELVALNPHLADVVSSTCQP